MGEFMSQEESEPNLAFICMYCKKHKNVAGNWEQGDGLDESVSDEWISHGICPDCLKEHFPDEYSSLREEGKIEVQEKTMPDCTVLYGSFFIVNNMGYLFGEYDREQRL